mgnify:CR=1 FL=1
MFIIFIVFIYLQPILFYNNTAKSTIKSKLERKCSNEVRKNYEELRKNYEELRKKKILTFPYKK